MRRHLARVLLALAAVAPAPTFSQDEIPPLQPREAGYAFAQPRVLVQQRLLGLAHGVSLLVSACMDQPERIDATLAAYVPWREAQENSIALAQFDLSRHYFGPRAAEARWPDLVRALNLRNRLELAPGSDELAAACETLPEALRRPRYDLGTQFRQQGLLAEATAGIEAELRWTRCREHLAGDERILLDARYAVWREINEPRLQRATTALQSDWPTEAPAESLSAWQELLNRDLSLRGRSVDCATFSQQLKQPRAALRNVFAPPPEQMP
ncbi:MAG: hypothetical protein KJ787_02340 [Gammaproteobacteria bacterium]|nr:hypothetical protein [Gammaproteobacteria bacterium]MBU1645156.1 hypothetical protein [Gammaproteobacteria bacterium]MBU1973393.1 hypothetical protein [Gammaproteobacteria bacterium]